MDVIQKYKDIKQLLLNTCETTQSKQKNLCTDVNKISSFIL